MSTAELKEKLHNYIETLSDKKLEAFYTLLDIEDEIEFKLTKEQIAELDKQTEDYLAGKLETYSWEEVKDHIKAKYEI